MPSDVTILSGHRLGENSSSAYCALHILKVNINNKAFTDMPPVPVERHITVLTYRFKSFFIMQ